VLAGVLLLMCWLMCCCRCVQEIAATVIWLVALNSAALPLATSANDTRIFCPKASTLELALILANTVFGVWRLYLLVCGFLALYVIVLQSVEKVFGWCERRLQNRVLPV